MGRRSGEGFLGGPPVLEQKTKRVLLALLKPLWLRRRAVTDGLLILGRRIGWMYLSLLEISMWLATGTVTL